MPLIRHIPVFAFPFILLGSFSPAQASDKDPAPELKTTLEDVVDMTFGKEREAIEAMLPKIIDRMEESFAIKVIVRRAFGRNWKRFNEEEQDKVIDLMGRLIIRTYADNLTSKNRPEITIDTSRPLGSSRWEIISTVTQEGNPIEVVYRLVRIEGKWKVYDVVAEGVNLVSNYRQQFDAHFERKSVSELFELLRKKLNEAVDEEG